MREKPLGITLRLSDMVCKRPVDVKDEAFTSVFQARLQGTDYCPGGDILQARLLIDPNIYLVKTTSVKYDNTQYSAYKNSATKFCDGSCVDVVPIDPNVLVAKTSVV